MVLGAAWLGLRTADSKRWLRGRGALAAATGAVYATAAMVALTIVWTLADAEGRNVTPAQMEVLRRLGTEPRMLICRSLATADRTPRKCRRSYAWSPDHRRRQAAPVQTIVRSIKWPSCRRGGIGCSRTAPATAGWLMVGIGRDQFSLKSGPLGSPAQPIDLDFPVDVRAIVVRGDEQARRTVRALTIEPHIGGAGSIAD